MSILKTTSMNLILFFTFFLLAQIISFSQEWEKELEMKE